MQQAHGLMVNYCYDLDDIEKNHEAYAEKGEVVASALVRKLLRASPAPRDLVPAQ
jgi:malonyl-CoA decarboxylase